jgi:CheY-like chemotaxis protein
MTRTILLVDDDESVLKTIGPMLQDAGYRVIPVNTARAGLDHLQGNAVDLIITDIVMPEMEGIEFIRHLKGRFPEVPVVAISGGWRTSEIDFLAFAKKLGAHSVLEKPFGRKDLLEAVSKVLPPN